MLALSWQDRFDAALSDEDRDAIKLAADWLRAQDGRVDDDVVEGSEPHASRAALAYLRWRAQRPGGDSFAFTRDLAERVRARGPVLSLGQVRGLLNCLRADALRADQQRAARNTPTDPEVVPHVPDGYFTIVETDSHHTVRIEPVTWGDFSDGRRSVARLVGPANESDYVGLGFYWPETGVFQPWKTHQDAAPSVLDDLRTIVADVETVGKQYALESGRCWRCGRLLTTPESIRNGIGPTCAAKLEG